MTDRRWSKARRLALEAFFLNAGRARRSNSTNTSSAHAYWQSVDWLVDESLARAIGIDGTHELTGEGWTAAAQLWHVPAATLRRMKDDAGVA